MSEIDRSNDRIVQLLRSKSGNSTSQWSNTSDSKSSKRPPRLQVNASDESEAHSMQMSVASREPSASIKAERGDMNNLDEFDNVNLDSVGPAVSHSSTGAMGARQSEDLSLRELNSLQSLKSMQSLQSTQSMGRVNPTFANTLGIVTTTEKYGNSIPSSPQRSPRRTPRGSSRHGSGSSGRSLAARSVGAQGGGKSLTPKSHTTPIRELDRMAIEAKAPPRFICPISGRVMRDPVILVTGTTCDRVALERRLAAGNKRCPVTNKNLRVPISMTPNTELRDTISVWARKNAPWMMDPTGIFLLSEETGRYELQGTDNQYVSTPTAGAAGTPNSSLSNRTPSRTPSRTENGKGSWVYTNGTKARPGNGSFNMSATPGTLEAGRMASGTPWYLNRGIASPRSSRKMSRSRSSRHGSGSPAKTRRRSTPGDWFSLIFLIAISVVYLGMFLFSLSLDGWKIASMSQNPWYGPSPQALVDAGAILLPMMNAPGNEWWRLFSSIFLPAGMIQMFICMPFLWLFGHPSRKSLPLPQASVAGVFLVSSLVGSMASANLNGKHVSCGAFSGIMSLIAVFCVDQMFSWPRTRLFNLKEWWLVALLMVSIIGGFLVISLFPLVDIWFSLGGLVGGLLLSLILIPMPRVQSQASGSRKKLIWTQSLSGVALLGVVVAASVGLALTPKLGQSVEVLSKISCVQMSSSMDCTPYGFLADTGCGLEWSHQSSAVVVACPSRSTASGAYQYFPTNATFSDIGNDAITQTECTRYCDSRNDPITVIAIPPASGATAEELMAGLGGDGNNSTAEAPQESAAAQVPLFPSPPPATTVSSPPPVLNFQPSVTTQTPPSSPTTPPADQQQTSLFGTTEQASAVTSSPTVVSPEAPTTVTTPITQPTMQTATPAANPTASQLTTPATTGGGANPWGGRGATPGPTTMPTTTNPQTVVELGVTDNQMQAPVMTTSSPSPTPSTAPSTITTTAPLQQQPGMVPASPAPLFG